MDDLDQPCEGSQRQIASWHVEGVCLIFGRRMTAGRMVIRVFVSEQEAITFASTLLSNRSFGKSWIGVKVTGVETCQEQQITASDTAGP